MLGPVLLSHLHAVGHMLLKGRVHNDLLGEGVTRQLPDELVLPLDLVLVPLRLFDVVIVLAQLLVIVLDAV